MTPAQYFARRTIGAVSRRGYLSSAVSDEAASQVQAIGTGLTTRIPKIIHVCWFGGGVPSPNITACLRSIRRLENDGYEIRIWTEDNYDLNKSERLIEAYKNKRWSLVSNYARIDILYEYGGIYLDSDIQIVRKFDDLLQNNFFIGFIWDCTLGTAVIGATPQHHIMRGVLDLYDSDASNFISPNNNTFTEYFLNNYPDFRLNGKDQLFSGIRVLNKFSFEHPSFLNRTNYTVHHFAQSWIKNSKTKNVLKKAAIRLMSLWLYRKYVCSRSLHISPYYQEHLRQKQDFEKRRLS